MAFCKYCGNKVNEKEMFCTACGKRLKNIESNMGVENKFEQINSNEGGLSADNVAGDDNKESGKIIIIIDGGMGQILRIYNDYFVINTTEDFYEPTARKIYKSKGATEPSKGLIEEFGEVGKEFGEAFAEMGEAFSSTYAEKRKKKLGVLEIDEGERRESFYNCVSSDGVNIGANKRGYISVITKSDEELLFFFDCENKDLTRELPEIFSVLKQRIFAANNPVKVIKTSISETEQNNEKLENVTKTNMTDALEQIRKMKELLDMNAITQDEFETMKKGVLK